MKIPMRIKIIIFTVLLALGLNRAQFPDTTGPVVHFSYPGDLSYFSCDSEAIIFKIIDQSPIDPISSQLTMWVFDTPYELEESLASPLDSFYYFPPAISFHDGDSIHIWFHPIRDIFFNETWAVFDFWIDFSPPTISLISPSEGIRPDTDILFTALISDSGAEVSQESSTVWLEVWGTDNWVASFILGYGHAIYSNDTLFLDVGAIGHISGGDTIHVCIDAADRAIGCGANRDTICFTYVLPLTPPEIELVYPFNGAIMASPCSDSLVFTVSDTDSIIEICVIINNDTLRLGDAEISFDGDTVIADISALLDDSEYYNIILQCIDIYAITSEYTFGIWTDFAGPFIVSVTPATATLLVDTIVSLRIQLLDYLAGIDPGSFDLTVNGVPTTYDFDSITGFLTFELIFNDVTDTLDVDLAICVNARDIPDFCVNYLDSCFIIQYRIDIRSPEFFPPDGTVTACTNQNLAAALFSFGGVDSSTVDITIQSMMPGDTTSDVVTLSDSRFSMVRHPAPPYGVLDSFIFIPEDGYWEDGSHIRCAIHGFVNHAELPRFETYSWYFYTDYSPPYLVSVSPPNGATAFALPDKYYIRFGDEIAGVLETAVVCTLYRNEIPRPIPFSSIDRVAGDTLALHFESYGFVLHGCDSIQFCTHCQDAVPVEFCGPNNLDKCINFSLDCNSPFAELISPLSDLILSCNMQTIAFDIGNDTNLDSASIMLFVNGDTLTLDDSRLAVELPSTLIFTPDIPWSDGQLVSGYLFELCDCTNNCCPSIPFRFIIDSSPPMIAPIYPIHGALITDSLAIVEINIYDEYTGLSDCGISADFGTAFTNHAGHEYYFDPSTAGIVLGPEDTINIAVWAADSAESCGYNCDTLSYWFVIDAIGPRLVEYDSIVGDYTSCDSICLSFLFEDMLGLDSFAVSMFSSHESETLTFLSSQINITESTITYCTQTPFVDNEAITLELITAPDRGGNSLLFGGIVESFFVDLSPPIFEDISIAPGETLTTLTPTIDFTIIDSGSGVNWAICSVSVELPIGDTVLYSDDTGIDIAGDTLTLSFLDAGFLLAIGDSASVCIYVTDAITDTIAGCPVHRADTCTHFYIVETPPIIAPARPGPSVITSCIDQVIDFEIIDIEGVDWDTFVVFVNDDTLNQSDHEIEVFPDSNLVRYTPPAPYDLDTVEICVIYARDILGAELDSIFCWSFFIDTIPPSIIEQSPVCNSYIGDTNPLLWAILEDRITYIVHLDSFSFDGILHPPTDCFWDDDSFAYRAPVELSERWHEICLTAFDQPDFCDSNTATLCCSFYVDITPPEIFTEPERNIVSSCDSFEFLFTAHDLNSVVLVEITSNGDFSYLENAVDETTLAIGGFVYAPIFNDTIWVAVTVTDSLGNSSEDSVYFIFDRTPPTVWIISPADSETLSIGSPVIIATANDQSGIFPDSAFAIIGSDTLKFCNGQIQWDSISFSINLDYEGIVLPERGYSSIILCGVSDSVSGNYGCPVIFAECETVTVFIADDDTLPPEIINPDSIFGWCSGIVFMEYSEWTITDLSGVYSAQLIISEVSDFAISETLALTETSPDIWALDTAIWFFTDTLWLIVCAVDADDDPGFDEDTTGGCGETFFIVCEKPFVQILDDTLDFGVVCIIDSAKSLPFRIWNPTGVPVEIDFDFDGDSVFNFSIPDIEILPGDTGVIDVYFQPLEEIGYSGSIELTLEEIDEIIGYIILLGSGKLCPLGFSAEPLIISPNNDSFYDSTLFTFPLRGDNKVEIFSRGLYRVRTLQTGELRISWNGTDSSNRKCPSGVYIYIAASNGEILGKGIIVIVR